MPEDVHYVYRNKILNLIAEFAGMSTLDIGMQDTLTGDLHLDSLDCLELIIEIEDEFDFEISDEEAEKLRTVQEVIDFVHDAIQGKNKVISK